MSRRSFATLSFLLLLAVTLPIVDLIVYCSLRFFAPAGLYVWIFVHWPAFEVAKFAIPPPTYAHAPAPIGSFIAIMSLCLGQAAIVGAVLGWMIQAVRRFELKNAL